MSSSRKPEPKPALAKQSQHLGNPKIAIEQDEFEHARKKDEDEDAWLMKSESAPVSPVTYSFRVHVLVQGRNYQQAVSFPTVGSNSDASGTQGLGGLGVAFRSSFWASSCIPRGYKVFCCSSWSLA